MCGGVVPDSAIHAGGNPTYGVTTVCVILAPGSHRGEIGSCSIKGIWSFSNYMKKTKSWFKSLQKWKKGGLIGCAVGIVIGALMGSPLILDLPWTPLLQDRLLQLHFIYLLLIAIVRPEVMSRIVGTVLIVVSYGGYGAIVGRVGQVDDPGERWLLTGLLVMFLLFFYWVNFRVIDLFSGY